DQHRGLPVPGERVPGDVHRQAQAPVGDVDAEDRAAIDVPAEDRVARAVPVRVLADPAGAQDVAGAHLQQPALHRVGRRLRGSDHDRLLGCVTARQYYARTGGRDIGRII